VDGEQYPIFSTAENRFHSSTFHFHSTSTGVHGPYPPPPPLPQNITYFGHVQRTARVPCASVFASLSYFSRHETMLPMVPPHLIKSKRQTRAEADALGQLGPTLDDMAHFIHQCKTSFVDFSMICSRLQHIKSTPFLNVDQPSYRLGTLTGRWQGSYIVRHICTLPEKCVYTIFRCHFWTIIEAGYMNYRRHRNSRQLGDSPSMSHSKSISHMIQILSSRGTTPTKEP
jgi:hypothetical protein